MTYSYETHVRPYADSFIRVKLDASDVKRAFKWALDMVEAKELEMLGARDSGSSFKRLSNGILGELAIERLLGTQFIDWSIGHSRDYQRPDLIQLGERVGIKTVEHGKFPIIARVNEYPQLINIYRSADQVCFVCGLASAEALNTYQSDELILSAALRRKGLKTGFYGFHMLTSPHDIIDKYRDMLGNT